MSWIEFDDSMDSIFFVDEGSRLSFLQTIMQSFGCTYVCLWFYLPKPSNCLVFLDGLYQEAENTQLPSSSSSSSTSMAAKFFNQYRQLVFSVEDGLVPGLSIKGNISCLHLNQSELQSLSSADSQRQFYLAARIKTSVFLGSINGEIELGFSTVISQVNMQMLMNNFIPGDFTPPVIPLRSYQNPQSSSSSSLRSLSMVNTSESSSILSNFQKTSRLAEATRDNPLSINQKPLNTTAPPHQLEMDSFAEKFNLQFQTRESEHAAITNALITVLSSTSSSSSSQPTADQGHSGSSSAFKKYASSSLFQKNQTTDGLRRRSMFNRSIEFFRNLNLVKIGEHLYGNRRQSSYHLHHKILERHRRKKLNENFQALRSVLPPTTKKDRDSVLIAAKEKLISSEAEVAELRQKNQTLMAAQGFADKKETSENETNSISNSSTERFSIRVTHVLNESPSEGLTVDLRIHLIGNYPLEHLIIRILEFLKQIENLSLVSLKANAQTTGSTSTSHLTFRLNVEGMEWDEASFQEAITRIVSPMAL